MTDFDYNYEKALDNLKRSLQSARETFIKESGRDVFYACITVYLRSFNNESTKVVLGYLLEDNK